MGNLATDWHDVDGGYTKPCGRDLSMMTISITRLRLRSLRYGPPFLYYTLVSARQARHAVGNAGVALRRHGGAYWTLTLWKDRAAVRDFMRTGPHRAAMVKLPLWCDEASLAHWDQETDRVPSWADAERHLATEGRLSAVKFPSAAQAAGHTLGS